MPFAAGARHVLDGLRRRIGLAGAAGAKEPAADRAAMKWYFATNEAGTEGVAGLHIRLMVLSALRNTRLRPHLITTGFRNDLTAWMAARGVAILDAAQPLSAAIHAAEKAGRYSTRYLGHWLRCEIPLIEREEAFVLYTDCDVVFLEGFVAPGVAPDHFAAAPEFRIDAREHANSGVMVMNVRGLRETLPGFLAFCGTEIGAPSDEVFHDQDAYNRYYRGRWTPLDPRYNWKPYWGDPAGARILHFHGAKLNALGMLYERPVPYEDPYWRQVGSLVASFPAGYLRAVEATLAATAGADLDAAELPERPWIEGLAERLRSGPPPVPAGVIDLSFLGGPPDSR